MNLKSVRLRHFRSHSDKTVDLGPITAVIGPNGVGKTNILEALWMLATTKSFRATRDVEVVAWGEGGAEISTGPFTVRVAAQPVYEKALLIDGVPQRTVDYLGELRAVLFTPDSLKIITGSPAERRRFMDTILAQRSRPLARALLRYRQLVAQRNALLRLIARREAPVADLELWDQQLVVTGLVIMTARRALVADLAALLSDRYRRIASNTADTIDLQYQSSTGATAEEFLAALTRERPREIVQQATLVGPHRDDLLFGLRGRPIADYASRGEIRSVILALKWSECDIVGEKAHPPLLLLDDLFSELDLHHREALRALLATTQTLCTTTDRSHLPTMTDKELVVVELA